MTTQRLSIAPVNDTFKLPKENGAVVVFSMACLFSILLSRDNLPIIALAEIALWAMMLSLHRPRQLLLITFVGMVVLLSGPAPLSLWIAVVYAGIQVTSSRFSKIDSWLREILGLTGAILAPLMVSYVVTQDLPLHVTVTGVLVAATLTGTALIRVSHRETGVSPNPVALLSLFLWISLAAFNSSIVALVLIPYVVQGLWTSKVPKPSFKQFGQIQCFCLLWVAMILTLHILDRIPPSL
ncbi:MAG: hypothetical protein K2Z81_11090 [Cyanobacteria bacterium]|nr:hypothetical protein [Cyanobacteriota bacterium]